MQQAKSCFFPSITEDMEKKTAPHILMFPLPMQSPVNSMLKLAELFCLAGFQVTFVNTEHNQKQLSQFTNIHSRFAKYPGSCVFKSIPDGLPEEHPRTVEQFCQIFSSLEKMAMPFFTEMIRSSSSKVTCFVAEGLFYYALDISKRNDIPLIYFDTISPCCHWVYLCIPKLIESGQVPVKGDDELQLNALVKSIPGMEDFLRFRDLPTFFRGDDLTDESLPYVEKEIVSIPQAHGLILNTFDDLDSSVLSHIRTRVPQVYTIGPIHKQLEARLVAQTSPLSASSNSLWEEDMSCMKWLNQQQEKSVLYVSFGSLMTLSKEEIMEFWHGFTNSGTSYLWVLRANCIKGGELDHEFMRKLKEGIPKGRGYIVNWAPQEHVLAHPATGGFLTHSGWNSTLESIVEGVPMICWPQYVDQNVTSRFVSEVWRLGLDMKDTCDRLKIEKVVRDLMGNKRQHDFQNSAKNMSELAMLSVKEGGSSYDLELLINDIKMLSS